MMKKLVAIALMSAAPLAFADAGFYMGAGVGQTSFDVGDTAGTGINVDDSDTGFKIYGGYKFNPNFAVEAGYADIGSATMDFPGFFNAEVEASALFVDAVGSLPLNEQFSVFGRVGLAMTNTELTVNVPGLGSETLDDDEAEIKFGLGAQFSFSKNVALRGEWERYVDVGGDNTGEGDVDVIGLSVNVMF